VVLISVDRKGFFVQFITNSLYRLLLLNGGRCKNLYAKYGDSELANTKWPKFRHDLLNTGRSN
jgi:hypothetical protein